MGFPEDIGVIDTMMGTTAGTTGKNRYAFLERALKDAESANMNFPAQYMFKDVPFSDQARDADGNLDEPPQGPDLLLPFMDRCNVEIAMVGIAASGEGEGVRCVTQHPDRFIPCHEPDPNDGVEAIRTILGGATGATVTASKGALGHTLGAAGGLGAIATICAM
ncbi:MAG: hypothetical protein EBY44_10810, partial [Actinobacteria bacterium]|nr:hypothetical protein [Actinomycetota bacterium]